MADRSGDPLIHALSLVAPGTQLRAGLDRILQAKGGALVVLGDGPEVLSICTGGFLLDAEFTPQRLSELAKMDGAVILAADASRIARANVHLVPRASIPTSETGTRHRTAERVARSVDVPVITVSEEMSTVAVYRHGRKHTLEPTARVLDRATQALSTVQRFKTRFDVALATLSTLEVEDSVSVRDVIAVLQPGEMVVRFSEEIREHLVELGTDGRLIRLQVDELGSGVEEALHLVMLDYVADIGAGGLEAGTGDGAATGGARVGGSRAKSGKKGSGQAGDRRAGRERKAASALVALHTLDPEDLLDMAKVARALGLGSGSAALDEAVESRGLRLLGHLPRVSDVTIERIVERFTTLPRIMQASLGDLEEIGGVGGSKARAVKNGLARLVEASILDRYD
ncbi:MAG: DNA integrity scanning diadenylate cyclase DisA [Actinomycetota bacterium]|nr:DNA integrity scanning diadenylate cyclase DisA [Actinomycetota bacterium]